MTGWQGTWVEDHAGIRSSGAGTVDVRSLAGFALRRNHKRLLLIVSTVLGKHIPATPAAVNEAASRLGELVRGRVTQEPVLVIGFAETATALGYGVAETLDAAHYIHSTRSPSRTAYLSFTEDHSHAVAHHLSPLDTSVVTKANSIVLVDDEISTGRTSMNIIRELRGATECRTFVVASLLDSRPPAERRAMAHEAQRMGITLATVALGEIAIVIPDDATERVDSWLSAADSGPQKGKVGSRGIVSILPTAWPHHLVLDGQDGFSQRDRVAVSEAVGEITERILEVIEGHPKILLVGIEEFMSIPAAVASALAEAGIDTRVCSTTRSPVAVIDQAGYPIRAALEFTGDPEQEDYRRYIYNVRPEDHGLVVVVAPHSGPYAASQSLIDALAGDNDVLSVRIWHRPTPLVGPAFSTYAASDVQWLLTDVTNAITESTGIERERTIQISGHYSESLPVEYTPDEEYLALFEDALVTQSRAVAVATARLAEQLLAARGEHLVLASLARAGTPAGVLVRRWLKAKRGLDIPHYTMSIILDRGLDPVALDFIRAHHDPHHVAFVDGWTGKGAISAELRRSLAGLGRVAQGFGAELGVLADPAATATWSGTDQDVLIPSACLNSTVSGLVSRTAYSQAFIPEGSFHGARFYAELAEVDRSRDFIESVTGWFDDIAPAELVPTKRTSGLRGSVVDEITRIKARHKVDSDSLIKPGVCEATRVLLRRLPELLVVREHGLADIRHLELLAATRGVPVIVDPDLKFTAVGIIRSARET